MLRFLIIGCGSAGRRHARNLLRLGHEEIFCYDVDQQKSRRMVKDFGLKHVRTLEKGFFRSEDVAIVCTPPNTHVALARRAASEGLHVLVEKPLSDSMEGIESLRQTARENGVKIAIGYNLRFDRTTRKVKKLLESGKLGKVLGANFEWGFDLTQWRPSGRYMDLYVTRRSMGGGIILDASHELDLARWWLGEPQAVFCMSSVASRLRIDVESLALIEAKMSNGCLVHLGLDMLRHRYARTYGLIGTRATLGVSLDLKRSQANGREDAVTATLQTWSKGKSGNEITRYNTNDMYLDELKQFIKCVEGRAVMPVNLEEAEKTLRFAMAAKKSAATGRRVLLS